MGVKTEYRTDIIKWDMGAKGVVMYYLKLIKAWLWMQKAKSATSHRGQLHTLDTRRQNLGVGGTQL